MGMYTELVLNVSLKSDIPAAALEVLKGMIVGDDVITPDREHRLFKTERWNWMLMSSSHYFVPEAHSKLITNTYCDSVHLTVRCDLKNYTGEIEAFIHWLAPFTDDGFAGYSRYEEDDAPTLIFFEGGKARMQFATPPAATPTVRPKVPARKVRPWCNEWVATK